MSTLGKGVANMIDKTDITGGTWKITIPLNIMKPA